jgi:molecular chaperone DnaK (HSP70)
MGHHLGWPNHRSSITREKFEEVCGDLWERALVPLQQVLADTGITLSQLHAVELIGGATRVPKLQVSCFPLVSHLTRTGECAHLGVKRD